MSNCFACGHRLLNIKEPCPNCGYMFDTDVNDGCPNCEDGVCVLTGFFCDYSEYDFGSCEIKSEAEKEAGY